MNVFNRGLAVFVALLLMAAAVALVALAWSQSQDSISSLGDAVDWLSRNDKDLQKVVLTAACAVVGFLALLLLMVELMPRAGPEVKVTDVKVGDATLSTAAIGQRVEEAVREVPHVASVRAFIRSKRKGVQVTLDLHVDPDANLAAVSDEACQAARDVLTDKVHVAMVELPRARLHYRELRLQRPGQYQPAMQPAAPVAPLEPETQAAATNRPPAEAEPAGEMAPEASAAVEMAGEPAAPPAGAEQHPSTEESQERA